MEHGEETNDVVRVLIVEDDPDLAFVVERALVRGWVGELEITVAGRLSEACEALGQFEPACVVLDIGLPDSEGLEGLTTITELAPAVPVVILTAYDDDQLAVDAAAVGAQDYVVKTSADWAHFSRVVRYAIERKRAQEELRERYATAAFTAEVATALTTGGPLSMVLRRCTDSLVHHLNASLARIWTVDGAGEVLDLQASSGLYTHVDGPHGRVAFGDHMIGMVARDRAPQLSDAVVGDPRIHDQAWAVQEGLVSFAGYPLIVEDRLVGVMGAFARQPMSDTVLGAMSGVSNQIAVGIDRIHSQAQLAHQALHDGLTGLPNRSLLVDRLSHALARRRPGKVAVFFLDVDRFKFVNDTLGHAAGDRLLTELSNRLQTVIRPEDTVARFGGDEFVVVCEELSSEWEATSLGDRLLRALIPPFDLSGVAVTITASIGIAVGGEGSTADGLLRDGDAAMYRAKELGRARSEVFHEDMRATVSDRLDLENALRGAIKRAEFRLEYQPVVSLTDGRITGVEALVRWLHPRRGLIPPTEFIGVAEELGIIVPLGDWVLREALGQTRRWQEAGHRLSIAVNLSPRQLAETSLVDLVAGALATSGVDPASVELELTEGALMDDVDRSIERLRELRGLGVRLAVDDFGTGYSSLNYLKRLPLDTLKIDRSFVSGLGSEPHDSSIVTAVVALAAALGLQTLAEGVETPEHLAMLRDLGCHLAQGYYFSRPVAADAVTALLEASPHW